MSTLIEEARTLVSLGLMGKCTLQVDRRTQDDWIEADPTQMKQVIVNLLINACDAMGGKGSITLTLDSQQTSTQAGSAANTFFNQLPEGRYITLSIRDEGPGIAAEHLDRIFKPFFTTKHSDKGTGLGLSVVQGIMARHSGEVRVVSAPGEGACFVLILPAQGEHRIPFTSQDLAALAGRRNLLYAEDDALVRDAWSALLERQGWVVTIARDGEEAWTQFQAHLGRWDAVLTDLSMPKMTGLQLARCIGSTTSPPPVILINGRISVEEEAELEGAGFSAVLHKPIDQDELLRVLNKAAKTTV